MYNLQLPTYVEYTATVVMNSSYCYRIVWPAYVEYTATVVMNSSFAIGLYRIEGKEGRKSSVFYEVSI